MLTEFAHKREAAPGGEKPTAAAYFGLARRTFGRAAAASEQAHHSFRIAGFTVRLSFAGRALVPRVTAAFAHLATSPPAADSSATPDLTIYLCDGATARLPLSPLRRATGGLVGGEVGGFSDERFLTYFQPEQTALSLLDAERGVGFYWTGDARRLPNFESATPLEAMLQRWLSRRGGQVVHAGAVGTARGGVLLAGRPGAGKSTAALACLDSALRLAGDDRCAVTTGPEPRVHSVYGSAALDAADLGRFPRLAPAAINADFPDRDRRIFFLNRLCPDRLITDFPLRALLLPRVAGRTRLERTSAAAALRALVPGTMFGVHATEAATFSTLAALARRLPCYTLEVGPNLAEIPAAIERLLAATEMAGGTEGR
jgi:hypothetical protein